NGGDVTVNNYKSNDRISLASGYAISGDPTVESGSVKLTVTDGTNSGTLTINGITATTPVKVGSDSGEKILYFKSGDDAGANAGSFNNADPGRATAVTAGGGIGDYGKLEDNAQTYGNLSSITASNDNAHLVGNSLANTFVLTGGESNILTGGIGKDTFIFGEGGGGIITDFGSGATKFGSGTALATAPTEDNRDKPSEYAEGNDILKVNGTVVEIAFNGHGVASTKNNAAFTAYVTYDADGDGTGDYTVMLGNIAKAPTKTGSSPVYKTDDVAAKTLKIWDTSSDGTTSKVLSSTALSKLFVTTSEYETNITALNDIVTNSGGKVAVVDLYGTNPDKDFTKALNGISYTSSSNNQNNG
ncbi:MAG: hypothetical protein IKD80_02455, partial [Selenomonadaceae bacterium]|nr:hypothetical protein [Selenomonadaceae bacterium]